jgi:tripartite-type tricarboxylate transporter receptor subunit TctC
MWLRLLGAAMALAISLSTAVAQSWPSRPIKAIIPFGAGSSTDVVPRIVFEQLAAQLGQPIVVENRAGAGGSVGVNTVAKAEPDGYTLLAHSNAYTVAPAIYPNLPYDPVNDISGVTPFGSVPSILVISPSKGIKTIQELVAAAKAKPGTFNFASVGIGSGTHLAVEKLKLSAGFDAVHVPFRGGPEALTEVVAGRVEFYYCPINTALPLIREGRLLGLVNSGTTRSAELPDVPTTLEAGYQNADFPIWIGMFAPSQTPRAIIDRLNAETVKALNLPSVLERLAKTGVTPMPMTPADFDARIRIEIQANAVVVKAAGIKPN